MAAESERLTALRNELWVTVLSTKVPGAFVNGPRERRLLQQSQPSCSSEVEIRLL